MCRATTVFFRHTTDGLEFGGKANAEHDSAFRFEGQHSSTLNGCCRTSRMRKTEPEEPLIPSDAVAYVERTTDIGNENASRLRGPYPH